MEIGSITSSYLTRVAASYASKTKEEETSATSTLLTEYDSYEKGSTENVESESYYGDYANMAEKILGKDLETAVHNAKRMIYGLSSALLNPSSSGDMITNYYDSANIIEEVSNKSLESLLGVSEEEPLNSVKAPEEAKDAGGVQDAEPEEEGETETRIVVRNGVRYMETTTTYSDGRTSVQTRALDGNTGKESDVSDLLSMLYRGAGEISLFYFNSEVVVP